MERISLSQLFTLTVFYQIGTTIIFGFGASAGKDAWIATIISILLGTLAIGIYLTLAYLQPGLSLVEWFPAQFGKWIGTPIAWMYPLMFLYEMARGLNDVKYLTTSLILEGTPHWAIIVLFLIAVMVLQLCGIEVLGRVGEIFLPYFLIMILLIFILLFVGDFIKAENLQPVTANGWQSIWKAAFPLGASQGFAQTLEFAMIWTLVHANHKDIVKTTFSACLISGSVILITVFMMIMGLGEYFFKLDIFPLFSLVSMVDIGDIIKNLNIFAALLFIISAIFKITLHMFFAMRSIQLLAKIENSRILIIPMLILSIYLGHSLSDNIQEHLQVAFAIFPYNLWLIFLWILPVILLIVTLIRSAVRRTT
ncbi:GerAB/ArcD/ProY family transporter [Bacillus tuaregi]|uniref:GerAB/ArcD/ProY family transporter n=1 Tax=Bacillus tuaregi TaxID=1816695 RepID=UPI0008F970AF|nr:endospore germination permease [Bacillus tuaregi]